MGRDEGKTMLGKTMLGKTVPHKAMLPIPFRRNRAVSGGESTAGGLADASNRTR